MKRLSAVACAFLAGAAQIVAAKPPATSKSAQSLARVTALESRSDDVQELMDVKMWSFDVRLPATTKSSKQFLVLEMRRKGHATENLFRVPLNDVSLVPSRRLRVSIGLYPPSGDMMKSKQVKYRLSTSSYGSDGAARPGFAMSNVIDNPFDAMNATYPGESGAIRQRDSSFLLFGGSQTKSGAWSKQTLQDIFDHKVSAASFDAALVFAVR